MNSWLYTSIWSNKIKTAILLILFPIVLYILCLLVCRYFMKDYDTALSQTNQIFLIWLPIIAIWWIVSLFLQKKIIFKYTWAKEITRKDNPRVYNIVENLCISKWIQSPKIWIIQDPWMNAFATWWNEKDSWIVFTSWLLENLNDNEVQSVAWHELTHILNRDCRLMAVIVIYIWIIGTVWQILVRSSYIWNSSSNSKWNTKLILILVGWICILVWYLFYPLIRLAISRKREFLADAGSVTLTKDNQSMISALQKISKNSNVSTIQKDTVAAMCIENPLEKAKNIISNLLSTHPPVEERIKALKNY